MKSATKRPLRFAAMRRVSTEQQDQVGESLRTQTNAITNSVAALGGTIVEWYGGQEHATPGYERKELSRLLQDARKEPRRFDAVILNDPDRWSRDNSASREGLELFRSAGIKFFTGSTEWDLFNPNHVLFLGMSAVVGEFFAMNQKRKSLLSRIERAKRGVPTGGKVPFGRVFVRAADRQTGHWEVIPEKKRMIEDVAKRYLAGESIPNLAKEYGVNHANLHKILTRRCGSKWNMIFSAKDLNIHEVVEINLPPLLPDKTIQAVLKKVKINRTYGHGLIKHKYLFARMIQCAHCGYAMMGQTNHGTKRYYRHMHTERARVCPGPAEKSFVPAAELEDVVMRHIFAAFGNPAAVQKAIEEATPNNEKIQEALRARERVAADLEKVKGGIQRVAALVGDGAMSNEDAKPQLGKLKDRQLKLETEAARLDTELAHIPTALSVRQASKDIAKRFQQYTNARVLAKADHANQAFDEMTYEQRRQLVEHIFNGQLPDGQRMGVFIYWEKDRKWKYRIEGHLINVEGSLPLSAKLKETLFPFGAPLKQKGVLNTYASHYRGQCHH